ncbi:hypothetical protein ABZ953_19295 [Streptomyces sp. NPDC046465]|uniref:hypothetical protein n=1 Tax=Streptomyces sp. NPDC046465 TaxID=3155810 RepID=UPI0033D89252
MEDSVRTGLSGAAAADSARTGRVGVPLHGHGAVFRVNIERYGQIVERLREAR